MACDGIKVCTNPGNYCPENKANIGVCEAPPLNLRVNPGAFAAGVTPVVPVLEEIFDVDCDETVEDVVISQGSGQSFYRTPDLIFNQRYKARLFLFQVDNAGTYTVRVLNNTFAPFITVSRSAGIFWQATGTELTIDVSVAQTGPMTIEVTTEQPQTFGSFNLEVDCGSVVSTQIFYWKMDTVVPAGGLSTTPPSVGGRNLLLSGPPGPGTVPGVINNGIQSGLATSDMGIDFAHGSFTARLWLNMDGSPFIGMVSPFRFYDPLGGASISLNCGQNSELRCTVSGNVGVSTQGIFILDETWMMFVFGWDDDAKRAFISVNGSAKITSQQVPLTVFNIVNGLVTLASVSRITSFDEVAIYFGKAWTDAEIANDYNGGAGRTYPNIP